MLKEERFNDIVILLGKIWGALVEKFERLNEYIG